MLNTRVLVRRSKKTRYLASYSDFKWVISAYVALGL